MEPPPPPELLIEIGVHEAALRVTAYVLELGGQGGRGGEPVVAQALCAVKPLEHVHVLCKRVEEALRAVRALQPLLRGWTG